MKYYEILPTHTETPRYTTRKIANQYIEFNYHFLTLQKKSHYFWTGVYNQPTPLVETRKSTYCSAWRPILSYVVKCVDLNAKN